MLVLDSIQSQYMKVRKEKTEIYNADPTFTVQFYPKQQLSLYNSIATGVKVILFIKSLVYI